MKTEYEWETREGDTITTGTAEMPKEEFKKTLRKGVRLVRYEEI